MACSMTGPKQITFNRLKPVVSILLMVITVMIMVTNSHGDIPLSLVPQMNHYAAIMGMAESAELGLAITLDVDGQLKIWSTQSGALLKTLTVPHAKYITFSLNGDHLLLGSDKNNIELWSLKDMTKLNDFQLGFSTPKNYGGSVSLNAAGFFKGSERAAFAFGNRILISEDLSVPKIRNNQNTEIFLEGYIKKITPGFKTSSIAASSGKSVYLVGLDGKLIRRIRHDSKILDFSITSNGLLLIVDELNRLATYSITTGDPIGVVQLDEQVRYVSFSATGQDVALVGSNSLAIYNIPAKKVLYRAPHSVQLESVCSTFTKHGVYFASVNHSLTFFDIQRQRYVELGKANADIPIALSVLNDQQLGVLLGSGAIHLFNMDSLTSNKVISPFERYSQFRKDLTPVSDSSEIEPPNSVISDSPTPIPTTWVRQKDIIAIGYSDGTIIILDDSVKNSVPTLLHCFSLPTSISHLYIDKIGGTLVVTEAGSSRNSIDKALGLSKSVHIVDIRTGKELKVLKSKSSYTFAFIDNDVVTLIDKITQTDFGFKLEACRYNLLTKKEQDYDYSVSTEEHGDDNFFRRIASVDYDPESNLVVIGTDKTYSIMINVKTSDVRVLKTEAPKVLDLQSIKITLKANEKENYESAITSVRIDPKHRRVFLGTEYGDIRIFDFSGSLLQMIATGLGRINDIQILAHERIALTTKDGYVGFIDLSKNAQNLHKETASLLVYSSDDEWLIVSPDGYFTSSPEGAGNLLYVGVGLAGIEAYSPDNFASKFKKPQVIRQRLRGVNDSNRNSLTLPPPPYVDLSQQGSLVTTSASDFDVSIGVRSFKGIAAVRVFVNGRAIKEVFPGGTNKTVDFRIPLYELMNRITFLAFDERGVSSNPKWLDVVSKSSATRQPNLHVLAIGVSDYPKLSPAWRLDYAHTDAGAIADAFKLQEGKFFGKVFVKSLTNKNVTPTSIVESIDSLAEVSKNDLVLIFMAGHGIRDKNGTFYYLTSQADVENSKKGSLDWGDLKSHLAKIKGRVIMLLDACHSGSIAQEAIAPNDELASQFFSSEKGGIMIFSASKGRQSSMESPDIGGGFGIFSYAIVQALGPKSVETDEDGNKFVEFSELVKSVRKYVDKNTRRQQTPWLSRRELFGDFPVTRAE